MKKGLVYERVERKAKIRRRMIKAWSAVRSGVGYKRAAVKESYRETVRNIENEVFDGILLSLSPRNCEKSMNVQMRLLRRIVEKRQAQVAHRYLGRTQDLLTSYTATANTKRCMKELRKRQNCL